MAMPVIKLGHLEPVQALEDSVAITNPRTQASVQPILGQPRIYLAAEHQVLHLEHPSQRRVDLVGILLQAAAYSVPKSLQQQTCSELLHPRNPLQACSAVLGQRDSVARARGLAQIPQQLAPASSAQITQRTSPRLASPPNRQPLPGQALGRLLRQPDSVAEVSLEPTNRRIRPIPSAHNSSSQLRTAYSVEAVASAGDNKIQGLLLCSTLSQSPRPACLVPLLQLAPVVFSAVRNLQLPQILSEGPTIHRMLVVSSVAQSQPLLAGDLLARQPISQTLEVVSLGADLVHKTRARPNHRPILFLAG